MEELDSLKPVKNHAEQQGGCESMVMDMSQSMAMKLSGGRRLKIAIGNKLIAMGVHIKAEAQPQPEVDPSPTLMIIL